MTNRKDFSVAAPTAGPRPGNAQWIGARQEQQDSFGFAGFDGQGQAGPRGVLAVLADGMGGLTGGQQASRAAVAAFLATWEARPASEPVPERLLAAMQAANRAVYELAHGTAGEGEVGTTLVAAAVHEQRLFWIAAGDSRLYLYRAADASLTPCNEEHNGALQLWRGAPANGETRGSIDSHPERNALISFLGLAEIPEIDRNIRPLTLRPGDRLLLCSDGVDGVLSTDEMKQGIGGDPQAAADGLIARLKALGRKHQDNATVAILACPGPVAVPVAAPAETPKPRPRRWLGTVAGVFVLLAAGGWYWLGWPPGTGAPKTEETARTPVPQVPAADQKLGENENTDATPDTTSAAPPNQDQTRSGTRKTETTATTPTTADTKPTEPANPDHPTPAGKKTETKAATQTRSDANSTTPPEPAPAAQSTKRTDPPHRSPQRSQEAPR